MKPERKLGKNARELLAHFIALEAVPERGNVADGLLFLTDPEARKRGLERAIHNTQTAIDLIKSAPDNPYGDDDEAIAAAILTRIKERKATNEA